MLKRAYKYILFICTVKQISDNEIYLLIKYIKSRWPAGNIMGALYHKL